MKKRTAIVLLLIIMLLMVSSSFAVDFDVTKYSLEELNEIQTLVADRINELEIQDAIENGDRKIEFNENDLLIYSGKKQKITVDVVRRYETAPKTTTLLWESDHPEVAIVTNGTINAITCGDAVITAKAKDNEFIQSSINVHVVNSISTLTISQQSIDLLLGSEERLSSGKLKADIAPDDAYNKDLSWTSSDESVVTVDENGTLQAVSAGKATITVETNDPSLTQQKKAICKVSVLQAVTGVNLSEEMLSVGKGKNVTIDVTVSPNSATQKKLEWVSSNPSVATVSATGVITGKATGNCTITCRATDGSNKSDTCIVSVIQQITGIQIPSGRSKNVGLRVGQEVSLFTKILPEDATNKSLHWTSSNINVVGVTKNDSQMATIKGKSAGTSTVTAKATDGSKYSVAYTVTVEGDVTIENTMRGNIGISWGTKWFVNQYKNTSTYRTIDGITIRYYAEDVYGNKIRSYGFGDYYQEEKINITIRPGETKAIDRITAYGLEDAKYIYTGVSKVHYTNGESYEIRFPNYTYWTYDK